MSGFITKRTVLKNTILICRLYGFRFWLAALRAPRGSTFLGFMVAYGIFDNVRKIG